MNVAEQRADIRTADGVMDTWMFQPPGAGPWPAVILYMDVIGIRAELNAMAARLAANGYVVALPNLFYRLGELPPVDLATFVAPGPDRDRVLARGKTIDGAKTMSDTAAILEHLRGARTTGRVGAVGYCMGGGYALRAAGTFPDQVAAAASFHGGALATDAPDSPHRLAPTMRGQIYVGVASQDHSFDEAQRERLRAALQEAGTDFEIEVYEGAKHGFAVTGHPVYDAAAAERHWQALLTLFREAL
ncbi:MAG: dienelactone hydrolase family protein [Acidimicrobiia bacterium]|nr:dienelactone hydrolase family protein [Acidimicrobiia bacterium]